MHSDDVRFLVENVNLIFQIIFFFFIYILAERSTATQALEVVSRLRVCLWTAAMPFKLPLWKLIFKKMTIIAIKQLFHKHFGEGRHRKVPDRKTRSIFLWLLPLGNLKEQVFKCRPETTNELKDFNSHEIAASIRSNDFLHPAFFMQRLGKPETATLLVRPWKPTDYTNLNILL